MARPRPKIISEDVRKSGQIPEATEAELAALDDCDRPQTRADCEDGPRPCPFVSCKYHLFLDVNPETGSLRITFPDTDISEIEESCALDVANQDGRTLEQVGRLVNLTRERIRQIEVHGLIKLEPIPGDPDYGRR